MKKIRFIETQIVAILKEADAGMKVADVCRKHGISQPTYYNWKSKYGGMSASELKRIKELEVEHSKLKRMYADQRRSLHHRTQPPVAPGEGVSFPVKRSPYCLSSSSGGRSRVEIADRNFNQIRIL